jgi:arylsulfatase
MDVGLDRRAPVFWELYERHGVYPYTGKIDDVWIYPGVRATA